MSSHVLFCLLFSFLFEELKFEHANTYVNEANCANDTNVQIVFCVRQQVTPSAHFLGSHSQVCQVHAVIIQKIFECTYESELQLNVVLM